MSTTTTEHGEARLDHRPSRRASLLRVPLLLASAVLKVLSREYDAQLVRKLTYGY